MAISNYNLCLAGTNYGVSVGKKATGTASDPKFEVAYDSFFEEDVNVLGSIQATSVSGDGTNLNNVTAAKVLSDGTAYTMRIDTAGAPGFITFIK